VDKAKDKENKVQVPRDKVSMARETRATRATRAIKVIRKDKAIRVDKATKVNMARIKAMDKARETKARQALEKVPRKQKLMMRIVTEKEIPEKGVRT